MQTALFKKDGGSIIASVTCTPQRDGSYTLMLWKAGENKVVKEWVGNFINDQDDSYPLAKPNGAQDGRLLECLVTVAVPGGVGPVTLALTIVQDGTELARESQDVPPGSAGGVADLFVQLKEA